MNNQWDFLKSNRFWAIVIGAVALAFYKYGVLPEPFFNMIETIVGAFTIVRTVDRFSETVGQK